MPTSGTGDLSAVAVIVPAYHPEAELLLPFAEQLREHGFGAVIVIDDGSGAEYSPIFDRARELGCEVLHHEVNRGKGRALKTGFERAAQLPGIKGVVTADSDGQHAVDDLANVARHVLAASPDTAVFGVRDFDGPHVPKNSRRGNKITRNVIQLLFGQRLSDTQTGLRGFPTELALKSADVKGERFEYEMNVVIWLMGAHHPIEEVPIATIYHDLDNSVSHFRPVQDSARIYGAIFQQFGKFLLSSVAGAAVDLGVYTVIADLVFGGRPETTGIVTATVVARIVSSLTNFAINRNAVFQDHSDPRRAMGRYYVLAAGLMGATALITTLFAKAFGGHLVWAKLLSDGLLFFVSYLIQKRWVFRDDSLLNR